MVSTKSFVPAVLSAVILGSVVSAGAGTKEGQWPRFRGPNGSGISNATTVPAKWTDKDYNWKITLPGGGHSSPVVWSGRIYVTCSDRRTAKRTVLCLDPAGGKTLWRRDYASKRFTQHRDNSYASPTPAADAKGVVITWTTPKEVILLALDPDGREVWRRDLGPFVAIHGSGSSPIIVGDLVVLANSQADPKALPSVYSAPGAPKKAGTSFVIAVDRKTGKTRWQIKRKSSQAAYSTPCLYQADGGRAELVFSSTPHGIVAVDPATGKINWEMGDVFPQRCVSSPVTAPGLVIAGDGYGTRGTRFVAIRPPSKDGARKPARGPQGPKMAYEIKRPVPLVPTPLVKGNRLFLWGDDGTIVCADVSNGKVIWRERIRARFYGSPVYVNGRLYCISREGDVFVLAAADKFELLARVPLGELSYATPAVCDGVMYLRTRSKLFSLGGKKPSKPAP